MAVVTGSPADRQIDLSFYSAGYTKHINDGVCGIQYSAESHLGKGGADVGDGVYVRVDGEISYHPLPKGGWSSVQPSHGGNHSAGLTALVIQHCKEYTIGVQLRVVGKGFEFSVPAAVVAAISVAGLQVWENPGKPTPL